MGTVPDTADNKPPDTLGVSGAAMRDAALRATTIRHRELLERSKRRQLTPIERRDVEVLTLVIDTLQAMAVETDS